MRDASKSGAAPSVVVLERLIGQRIESTSLGVPAQLRVPRLPVMFQEPGTELLRLFSGEGFDRLLKSLELCHDTSLPVRMTEVRIRTLRVSGQTPQADDPLHARVQRRVNSHRSLGVNPVLFAMRVSILGPISSRSWKAKVKSGQPDRSRTRWEPRCRLIDQPIRSSAARTRRALVPDHPLTRQQRRCR